MLKSCILFLVTLYAALVMAAPIATSPRSSTAAALSKRSRHHSDDADDDSSEHSGRGTWFSDDSGSCDIDFDQDDMIVAMNESDMGDLQGSGSQCGKMVRVSYGGKSVDLKVVDTCPESYCDAGALDLSQAAFKKLAGDLDKGVISLKWEYI